MLTFSQPSGGSRARKRLMRGDASVPPDDAALSSGEVLWLSSIDPNGQNKNVERWELVNILQNAIPDDK